MPNIRFKNHNKRPESVKLNFFAAFYKLLTEYWEISWLLARWWGHSCKKWGSRGLFLQVWQPKPRFGAFLRPYLQQIALTALVTQGMAIFWGKAGRKWRGSRVRSGSVCAGVCGPEGASAKGITPVFSKPFRPWKDRSRHERRLPEAHTPPCTLNLQCQIIAENR